jgi:hypothetical protein
MVEVKDLCKFPAATDQVFALLPPEQHLFLLPKSPKLTGKSRQNFAHRD